MAEEKADVVIEFPIDEERQKGPSSPISSIFETQRMPYNEKDRESWVSKADGPDAENNNTASVYEEALPRPLTEIDYYIERRRALVKEPVTMTARNDRSDYTIDEILDHYVEPASVIHVTVCAEVPKSSATLDGLRTTYSDSCEAVVEFEKKISTLRANSKSESLTLAQTLVTQVATGIFKTLRDFEPPPRPELHLSNEARERMRQRLSPTSNQLELQASLSTSKVSQNQDVGLRRRSGNKSSKQEIDEESKKGNDEGDMSTIKTIAKETALAGVFDFVSATIGSVENRRQDPVRLSSHDRAQIRVWAQKWERERSRLLMLEEARDLVLTENRGIGRQLGVILRKIFSPTGILRLFLSPVLARYPNGNFEKAQDALKLREFEQAIAPSFDWKVHRRWAQSMHEKRKNNWKLDWGWELDWDREWERSEEMEWQRSRDRHWFYTNVWPSETEPAQKSRKKTQVQLNDGDWISQMRNEMDWLKHDRALFPDDWNETEWLMQLIWRRNFETWCGQWKERKRTVDDFANTCIDLAKELRNIDGSALTQELNIFHGSDSSQSENHQLVIRYIADMREAMTSGRKGRFMGCCNSIFKLVNGALRSYEVETGLELLIKKQDHYRNSFMDFATVAIFFSSITATTLSFSYASANSTVFSTIVNVCWFASLVLSIASATNSFLGAIVHQSTEFLRPSQKFDRQFLQKWFKFIPSSLLALSGALFLAGLCTFTFSSTMQIPPQGKVTQIVTLSLTSSNFVALIIMLLLSFTRVIHIGVKAGFIMLLITIIIVLIGIEIPLVAGSVAFIVALVVAALAIATPFLIIAAICRCVIFVTERLSNSGSQN